MRLMGHIRFSSLKTISSLKTKYRQFDNFVVTDSTVSCCNDNLLCHQWQQSCQIDNLLFTTTYCTASDNKIVNFATFCFQGHTVYLYFLPATRSWNILFSPCTDMLRFVVLFLPCTADMLRFLTLTPCGSQLNVYLYHTHVSHIDQFGCS